MKERITITLDSDLLSRVDSLVDNHKVKNRSHALSILARKALGSEVPDTAVILCGGKGTRFRPITYEIPKQLLPIQGKPILEHLLDLFKKYGVRNIILSVGYLKDKIKAHFGDGSNFGVRISYIEEDVPLGTGGALSLLKGKLEGPFFVSNGDELKDVNLQEMFESHKRNKAIATIALTTVEDVSQYGVVSLSGMRILDFVEKPSKKDAPSNLINSGLYLMDPSVFDILSVGNISLEKEVFPKIISAHGLFGYVFSGQWFDTGNAERYERALKNWKGLE